MIRSAVKIARWSQGLAAKVAKRVLASVIVWACLLNAVQLFPPPLNAQEIDERVIKAAYVFNLTKYVNWPNTGKPLVVGFVGDGPMGETLEKMLTGKTSESRVIQVVFPSKDDALNRYDVLYISYRSPFKVHAALEQVRNKPVLTVGDSESFSQDGGMIGLVKVGQQVRMDINLEAVRRAQLKISSRVLNLATIVHDAPKGKN